MGDERPLGGVFEIVYVSVAKALFSPEDLRALLASSRAKNRRLEVTGLLVYDQGAFLQVIEGPEAAVSALYATIAADPRHEQILRLFASLRPRRSFGDWTMGFVEAEPGAAKPPGYNDFFRAGFTNTEYTADLPARTRDLALQFRLGRWRPLVKS